MVNKYYLIKKLNLVEMQRERFYSNISWKVCNYKQNGAIAKVRILIE